MINSNSITFNNLAALEGILKDYGISTDSWQKNTQALFEEIVDGECYLEVEADKLIRKVDVIRVLCFHENDNGEKFKLKEDKQVSSDGKVRFRKYEGLSEKRMGGEKLEIAALRALKEELQIPSDCIQVIREKDLDTVETKDSATYPELKGVYNFYYFSAKIPISHYRQQYIEDKTFKTYFSWEKI